MKTRIFISLFLLISVTSFILYRPADRTNTASITSETTSGNSDGRFLIGAMQSFNDETFNYVHYDSMGLDLCHTYTGTSDTGPVTNQRYPYTNMAMNDKLLTPVDSYKADIQNKISGIYMHNQSRLILMRPKIEWLCYGQRSDYQCEDGHRDTALWFYSFQRAGHNGGVDSQDFRYGNGNWVRYFRSQNSNHSGAWVDGIGTVISKLKANTEQCRTSGGETGNIWQSDLQFDWYIKPRIRIDSVFAANFPNSSVCKIKVIKENGSDILKEVTIKASDFWDNSNTYDGSYKEEFNFASGTDLKIHGPWGSNDKAYWQARGNRPPQDEDNKADIQVYWYGNCDMWIDYIRVDNEVADKLFKGYYDDPIHPENMWIKDEAQQIGLYTPAGANTPAAYKFYIELTEFNNMPCIAYVNKKLKEYSSGSDTIDMITDWTVRNSIHVPWENRITVMTADFVKRFWIDSIGLRAFYAEAYPFNSDNSDPATSNSPAKIPNTLPVISCGGSQSCGILSNPVPPGEFDSWLQDNMDHQPFYFASTEAWDPTFREYLWARGISRYIFELGDNISRTKNIPFILMPQSHSWYNPDVEIHNEPTNEELDLQANLAVSYGARGLMYFAWDSKGNPGDPQYHRALTEPDGTLRQKNVYGQIKTKKQTMIDLIIRMKKWEPYIMSFENGNRKTFIYRIPAERTDMNNYTFIRDMSTFPADPLYYPVPDPDVLSLETNNDTYLQASFFQKENETEQNKYFMIVNRRCSPFINYNTSENIGGKRFVFMRVNSTNLPGFNNWKIIDLGSGDSVLTFNKNDTAKNLYLGEYDPGEGRLYRVAPVMQEGGALVANEECSGTFDCKGEVNNNGKNITLRPATTINFKNTSARIIMSGGVFKSGYSTTDNTAPVYLNTDSNNYWKGLLLNGCDTVKMIHTFFRNVSPYPSDSTYAADLINCRFIDIESSNFLSELDIKTGCIRASYVTNEDVDYSAYLYDNTFEIDAGEVPAVSFISTGGLTFPLIIDGNNFSTTTQLSTSNAVFLSNITGGVIKNNIIAGYSESLILLSSATDVFNNVIDGNNNNSIGIQAFSQSDIHLSPTGSYYTGGQNQISSEGGSSKCVYIDKSSFDIYKGENTFEIKNYDSTDSYHLFGWFPTHPSRYVPAEYNCFKTSGTNTEAIQDVKWVNGVPVSFSFTPYNCDIEMPVEFELISFGNGVNDTLFYNSGGEGGGLSNVQLTILNEQLKTRSETELYDNLVDSVGINIRRRNYVKVFEYCTEFLDTYPDSIESIGIISKLYIAGLRLDSAGNKITNLKSYLETLILNNPENEALINRTFYFIQKCKVSLKQYESALQGFQQIIDQNPYSYEGLVASWDYSATSLLFEGPGGAGGGISNYKLQISNNGSRENERENEREISYDEKSQIRNSNSPILNDDPNDKYDTRSFTKEDRKVIRENVFRSYETSGEKEIQKIKTLERKISEGTATKSEKKELETKKVLKEIVKIKKPKDIASQINTLSNNIKKIFNLSEGNSMEAKGISIPVEYYLSQNYPNPFNPTTKINFDLPNDSKVSLIIYDLLGREIIKLVNNEFRTAGSYTIEFNAGSLSSGVYFYRLEAGDFVQTKRMVLVK